MSVATDVLMSLVEAKPVMAAAVASLVSAAVLQSNLQESIVFGGSTALGVSFGDALLTGAGFATDIRSYLPGEFAAYVDPLDFVGAAVGVGLISFALGVRDRPLAVMTLAGAVSGGIAPKLSSMLFLRFGALQRLQPNQSGSSGQGGSSLIA